MAKRTLHRLALGGAIGALAFLALASSVASAARSRPLGMVPSRAASAAPADAANNLVYHGGPVMHTNTVYAIYWVPSGYSVSTNYESLIDRYFQDEAADSGKLTNVYSADPQYTDGTGSAAYSSTFGGSVVDATAYPSSGCVDSFGIGQQTSVCLTDAQIQTEIDNVATAQGWSRGLSNLFILLTPKNVGSCFSAGMCAYSFYCGYHDDFTSGGSGLTLYANLPYDAYSPAGLACTTGVSPNGDDADATINVASHEHREAITDPEGNAWYDSSGNESADKCAMELRHEPRHDGLGLLQPGDQRARLRGSAGVVEQRLRLRRQHGGARRDQRPDHLGDRAGGLHADRVARDVDERPDAGLHLPLAPLRRRRSGLQRPLGHVQHLPAGRRRRGWHLARGRSPQRRRTAPQGPSTRVRPQS